MSSASIWAVILGGMVITYALRSSFLVFLQSDRFPAWFIQSLRFTPAVVLAALVAQLLVKTDGVINISIGNPRVLAGIIAFLVALKTKNAILTLIVGMCALWLLSYL